MLEFVCAVITKSVLSGRLAADCMNQSHLHIVHKELEGSSWTWRETVSALRVLSLQLSFA